jgi:hypothetical protein
VTEDETLRGLSIQAAQKALEMAQVKSDDVDLVLLCTSTPDDLFGGAAQVLCNLYSSINSCNRYLQPLIFLIFQNDSLVF